MPAISCPADHFAFNRPDYVPSTPAIEADWLSRSQTFAEQCATTQRDLLDHMKTADMAADMDLVRAALGVPKVLLYGQSYGTPTSVRSTPRGTRTGSREWSWTATSIRGGSGTTRRTST